MHHIYVFKSYFSYPNIRAYTNIYSRDNIIKLKLDDEKCLFLSYRRLFLKRRVQKFKLGMILSMGANKFNIRISR